MKELKILCEGTVYVNHRALEEFQEDIKTITPENLDKLIASISKGFKSPLFIWDNKGDYYILDGHQRVKALMAMEEKGWKIPPIPAVLILEKTKKKAKEAILIFISQYGEIDPGTISMFMRKYDIKPMNLVLKKSEINLDMFNPVLNPTQMNSDVTGLDMDKAQRKIEGKFNDTLKKIELICPCCNEVFYMDQKEYELYGK